MNKAAKLLKEISEITKDDPHLIYRDFEEVGEAFINEEVIMHVEADELLGFIMCKKITTDIYELASLYVKPEHRGKGIAKGLLSQALEKVNGRDVITRTSNKAIKQSLIEHNFRPVSMKTNLKFAYIYLKDRLKSKDKFLSFVNTLNNKNCLFFRAGHGANPTLF
jgi:ribosomal protein S18 acetylase RimI-like enzyme